ncbi:hypothetical protein HNR05_001316 [Leifsonia psychrotolerans]|uniref:Uncharacterized protein n=1 Tax=Glaciibacter psychrotolerans TaxID=670054 RepID=A0A7Z0EE49_9MICO|nr:hypothetical protein [Leifsonia psychrotolerans]
MRAQTPRTRGTPHSHVGANRAATGPNANKVVFATLTAQWSSGAIRTPKNIAYNLFPRIDVEFIAGLSNFVEPASIWKE